MESLGEVLKRKREELGLSLREVEQRTGVSNAYLSQVENRKITQPSPTILRKLSDAYVLSFDRLMLLAGHPITGGNGQSPVFFRTSRGLEEVTKAEEEKLLDYLRFLRMKSAAK
jgi:transcriptional regulator with XRE-family HTH domain